MYNPFCADLVAAVYAENREDVARLTDAISRTQGVSFASAAGVVRKHPDYKRIVRRHVPPAADLRARIEQLIAVYKDKCDPHGHCILHEHALRTIQNKLGHVDSHCVSGDDAGVYEKTGARTLSGNGCDVTLTTWRSLRGTSQLEGFHPTQSQTLGSGGVGLLLGEAQLLEAAIRRYRGINAIAIGLRRVIMDNSVLSRSEPPKST